ncbi:MAG TPA: hypothetical protein VMV46_15725 [Thermoanaerobaculia bacterium]|nr:hypothetical protein [Thermoanaerobaculia bacterium]
MTEPSFAASAGAPELPTRARLLATLAVSLVVAAVLLVTTVLPAEYGIDPTGVGRALGLDRLGSPSTAGAPAPPMPASEGGRVHDQEIKRETVEVAIGAREEIEYKVGMVAGATALYRWSSTAPLYSDFHAEPYNDLDGSPVRYLESEGASAQTGAIRAPFSGLHGWYWRNESAEPVTVTLEVTGFWTHFKEVHRAPISGT